MLRSIEGHGPAAKGRGVSGLSLELQAALVRETPSESIREALGRRQVKRGVFMRMIRFEALPERGVRCCMVPRNGRRGNALTSNEPSEIREPEQERRGPRPQASIRWNRAVLIESISLRAAQSPARAETCRRAS